MKSFIQNQEGQILILMTFLMTLFLGITALVVDFGSLYLEKNRLQKIVDAAVFAGAQELPGKPTNLQPVINQTISANDGNPNNFSIQTNTNYTILEVEGRANGTLYFAKAFGVQEPVIVAKARIEFEPISAVKGAMPLAVPATQNLAFGTRMTLKEHQSFNGFSSLRLSGKGASDFENDVLNGYGDFLKVGDIVETRQGAMTGKTEYAFQTRINTCPYATHLNYPKDCKRVVIVPVYKQSGMGTAYIEIIGFATFFIENVAGDEVIGRFIKATIPAETSSTLTADFGTYSYKLTR